MIPETYELYLKTGKNGYRAGWNRWNETSFATPWAGESTPWEKWHIVVNKSFFFREIDAFVRAFRGGNSQISAAHAQDIAKVLAACYRSNADGGQHVAP